MRTEGSERSLRETVQGRRIFQMFPSQGLETVVISVPVLKTVTDNRNKVITAVSKRVRSPCVSSKMRL